MPRINLINKKIGRLTVLSLSHKLKPYTYYWKCLCECKSITFISTSNLTKKNPTKSCGCLQRENIAVAVSRI